MKNQSLLQQAKTFRQAANQPIGSVELHDDELDLQFNLIDEEYAEFIDAFADESFNGAPPQNTLKELGDLVFVCYQFAAARGWDLDVAMRRIFESNMTKVLSKNTQVSTAGKILKGSSYIPPILSDLV